MANPQAPTPSSGIDAAGKKSFVDRAKGAGRKLAVGAMISSQVLGPEAVDLSIEGQVSGKQTVVEQFKMPAHPYDLGGTVRAAAPRSQGVNDSISAPSNQTNSGSSNQDQDGRMTEAPDLQRFGKDGDAGQSKAGSENPRSTDAPEGTMYQNPQLQGFSDRNASDQEPSDQQAEAGPGLQGPFAGQLPADTPGSKRPVSPNPDEQADNPETNPDQENQDQQRDNSRAQDQNQNGQNQNGPGQDAVGGLPSLPGIGGIGEQPNAGSDALGNLAGGATGQELKQAKNEQFWAWYFGIFPGLLDLIGLHVWWIVGHYRKEVALSKSQKIALVVLDVGIPILAGAIFLSVFAAFCLSPLGWAERVLGTVTYGSVCKPFQPF